MMGAGKEEEMMKVTVIRSDKTYKKIMEAPPEKK